MVSHQSGDWLPFLTEGMLWSQKFLTLSINIPTKGGLKSESAGRISNLPKLVPKTYLVLFNAVHSVDRMANLYLFVFTSLIIHMAYKLILGIL